MSNLSTFAEVGLVDARASAGTLIIPRSTDIPGRVITYKDLYGATGNSTIALICSTTDTFEDGSKYKTLQNPFDFITLYAASTNMWAVIGGTQVGGFRAPITSNASNFTSSIQANTVNTAFTYASYLYPQVGLSNVITSNVLPVVNATTTGIVLGNITSNFYQIFNQSTITSNIGASFSATSTIFVNASLVPAYSTSYISTMTLGTSTNRWNQIFAVSTIVSTLINDNAIVNNLVGGPILNATTTTNIYPYSAGSLVGFGATIASNGFYAEGHFRSTFTQVIQPTLDNNAFSNIVYINGNISTPNIYTSTTYASLVSTQVANISTLNATNVSFNIFNASTFNTNNMSSGLGFVSSLNVNALTVGSGTGYVSFPFLQTILTSSIQINTSILNASTLNINVLSTPIINTSTITGTYIAATNFSVGNFYVSSFNANAISAGTLIFSTLSFQNISIGTGFISSLNVNSLTFGAGTGYADFTAIRAGLVSSIQADTGAQKLSSLNLKMPPFWSTLIIPPSSFSINGANAGTPIILYSNVPFPPYTKGYFNLYQKCILSKTAGTNTQYINGNIFYTQGQYPSSTTIYDGYSALPYVADVGASTFTTCASMVSISTIITRNICFYDARANTYSANLYLGNLIVQYVPSFGFAADIGQNLAGVN